MFKGDSEALTEVYREAQRLMDETGKEYQVDHIVPVRARDCCGLTVSWNCEPVDRAENNSKNNRYSRIDSIDLSAPYWKVNPEQASLIRRQLEEDSWADMELYRVWEPGELAKLDDFGKE